VKAFAVALPVLTDVLNREGIGISEVFAALDAGMMFVEVCQESISNQAGMGNKTDGADGLRCRTGTDSRNYNVQVMFTPWATARQINRHAEHCY
jgi:hypothetical protein